MPAPIDLSGHRYGRWLVKQHAFTRNLAKYWLCICECGASATVRGGDLRNGKSRSCGCLNKEVARAKALKHGLVQTPEYRVYQAMLTRCYNPNALGYPDYGGRGITVCDRWRFGEDGKSGFECFYIDMKPRPTPKHSIERGRNDDPYDPGNCRWGTRFDQNGNKRDSVRVVHEGKEVCLAKASRLAGLSYWTVWSRRDSGLPESEWFKPVRPPQHKRKRRA